MALFSENIGSHSGTLEDGKRCSISVSTSGEQEGYTIKMTAGKIKETAYADSEKNVKNNFDKAFMRPYVSAVNGGWMNSNFEQTKKWEMRVYFKDSVIQSFSISGEDEGDTVCTMD